MKKNEKNQMHDMKHEELDSVIKETQKSLAEYLISRYSKQSKNVHIGRQMRRKIAVAKTIARVKELSV